MEFFGHLRNRASHEIIKEITFCGVRRLVVCFDVVAEIFYQPRLGSYVSMALSPVARFKVFPLLSPRSRTILPPLRTRCRPPCWVWGYLGIRMELTSTSLTTTFSIMMWTVCLIFININMNLSSDWHPNTLTSFQNSNCKRQNYMYTNEYWIFWPISQNLILVWCLTFIKYNKGI